MKKMIVAALWLLAAVFSGVSLLSALLFPRKIPLLLSTPEEAVSLVEELMDAVCRGDFETAETMLYGQPDLGADRSPADPAGAMIWQAYIRSLDYELLGQPYPGDMGLVQDVKLISIELPTATRQLNIRTQQLLNEAIAGAQDISELYDENNEYREELVMDILYRAVEQALEEDVRYTYQVIPLKLVYRDGQWKGIADRQFLNAISGGISE